MLYYGYFKANCNCCGSTITEMYDGGWKTRTEINKQMKEAIREKGGAVTRDERAYCKECKEKLNITRGRKKRGF